MTGLAMSPLVAPLVAPVVAPGGLWRAWPFDPAVVASLAGSAAVYWRGWRKLARRGSRAVAGRQAAAFFAGLWVLAVALVSPLDALATTLLSAHMAQHLLLLAVAPPLIVYGRPGLVMALGLPEPARRRLAGITRRRRGWAGIALHPLVVLVLATIALWGWHLPGPYQAALRNPPAHAAEHVVFLATALAFWSLVIDPGPRRRLGYAPGMLLVFVSMLASSALGALITFSPLVLYPLYQAGASMWGTTALADQQLAGAVMWVPPGLLYLVVIVVLARRWFDEVDRRVRRAEGVAA
ncbi:MAG TPA: cytochrome c oxidase assembly protein [Actinomycetota bacterium]|nr:cytochrome c oxidase assembly protein [Actinomycetota bacterium]